MRRVGGVEGVVSEVALEFGGWIHCGDGVEAAHCWNPEERGCASSAIRAPLHFFVEFMICVRSLHQTLLFSKV
jgi:hypothetical protein